MTACKALGLKRLRILTARYAWQRFISDALAGWQTFAEVRVANGHTNVAVTSAHLHKVMVEQQA